MHNLNKSKRKSFFQVKFILNCNEKIFLENIIREKLLLLKQKNKGTKKITRFRTSYKIFTKLIILIKAETK